MKKSICWKDFPLCWAHLDNHITFLCCFGEQQSLRKPFPGGTNQTCPDEGSWRVFTEYLAQDPFCVSCIASHRGAGPNMWRVKNTDLGVTDCHNSKKLEYQHQCPAFTLSSADSRVPFWSTHCCSSWCQCWQEFLEMPQTLLWGVGYDCLSPHTDLLEKQETCHCCRHF